MFSQKELDKNSLVETGPYPDTKPNVHLVQGLQANIMKRLIVTRYCAVLERLRR